MENYYLLKSLEISWLLTIGKYSGQERKFPQKLSENEDDDDSYKFFWNEKTGKKQVFRNLGVGKK